jgi:cobalamin biosynthesis protein CobW
MELLQTPELAKDFILDATLAVVDTPLLLSDQFDRDLSADSPYAAVADSVATLFEQQLEFADVVVLNKVDALDEDALLLAEQRVRDRAPNVRFLELAYNAQLDIRLALGLRLHQPTFTPHSHRFTPIPGSDTPTLASHLRLNGHAHSGLAGHSHGLATHKHFHEQDPGWLSFVLRSQEPQQAETLIHALIETAKAEPLLRCKGFISTPEQSILVQGVRTRVAISIDTVKQSSKDSELVFIGYHLNRTTVATLLSELTGTDWK